MREKGGRYVLKHDILFLLKCCMVNLAGSAYLTLEPMRDELLWFSRGLGQADVPWQSCSGQRDLDQWRGQ